MITTRFGISASQKLKLPGHKRYIEETMCLSGMKKEFSDNSNNLEEGQELTDENQSTGE